MPKTTVVHIREPHDVYIGRGRGIWGNPYRIGVDGTRDDVLKKFRAYLLARPDLLVQARQELRGKRLGCFCAPLPCHGNILAELIDQESGDK